MSMLSHGDGRSVPPPEQQRSRRIAQSWACAAIVKRVCLCALVMLSSGTALTAIIALKTAAYVWRLPH